MPSCGATPRAARSLLTANLTQLRKITHTHQAEETHTVRQENIRSGADPSIAAAAAVQRAPGPLFNYMSISTV